MNIKIRAQEPTDADDMLKVIHSERAYSGTLQLPFFSLDAMRKRLSTPREGMYLLVAEVEGEVVGSIGLHVQENMRRRHVADIGMMVRDDMQGKGVGSALMAAIIELGEQWLNVSRIELTVYTDNAPAIALYKKFGFEIEGTHRKYAFRNGDYVDAYAMARISEE
jgi:L-phenylalanine/L-methionine N-acetyltransferase